LQGPLAAAIDERAASELIEKSSATEEIPGVILFDGAEKNGVALRRGKDSRTSRASCYDGDCGFG